MRPRTDCVKHCELLHMQADQFATIWLKSNLTDAFSQWKESMYSYLILALPFLKKDLFLFFSIFVPYHLVMGNRRLLRISLYMPSSTTTFQYVSWRMYFHWTVKPLNWHTQLCSAMHSSFSQVQEMRQVANDLNSVNWGEFVPGN